MQAGREVGFHRNLVLMYRLLMPTNFEGTKDDLIYKQPSNKVTSRLLT